MSDFTAVTYLLTDLTHLSIIAKNAVLPLFFLINLAAEILFKPKFWLKYFFGSKFWTELYSKGGILYVLLIALLLGMLEDTFVLLDTFMLTNLLRSNFIVRFFISSIQALMLLGVAPLTLYGFYKAVSLDWL